MTRYVGGTGLQSQTSVWQVHIVARRRMLRRAFDIVRPLPAEQETVNALAKAISSSSPVTDAIVTRASKILRSTDSMADLELMDSGTAAHRALSRLR